VVNLRTILLRLQCINMLPSIIDWSNLADIFLGWSKNFHEFSLRRLQAAGGEVGDLLGWRG
jgi:hypothetical protein